MQLFVGGGLNYTSFTQAVVNSTCTSAFGGTSSSTKLKAGAGAVWQLGVDVPLSEKLALQVSATRYLIKTKAEVTTETPGIGPITRLLTLRSDPDVYAVMLGYRFRPGRPGELARGHTAWAITTSSKRGHPASHPRPWPRPLHEDSTSLPCETWRLPGDGPSRVGEARSI